MILRNPVDSNLQTMMIAKLWYHVNVFSETNKMNAMMMWVCAGLAFAIMSGCAGPSWLQTDNASEEASLVFNPIRVVPSQSAITDVPVIAASEVNKEVYDKELVLGVVVNGEARAYPINMLTGPSREIINDTLGGRAIAASW